MTTLPTASRWVAVVAIALLGVVGCAGIQKSTRSQSAPQPDRSPLSQASYRYDSTVALPLPGPQHSAGAQNSGTAYGHVPAEWPPQIGTHVGHAPPSEYVSHVGHVPFETYSQGEYVGPSRAPHVLEYRLRVDDTIEFVFRLTGNVSAQPYRFDVGDTLRLESLTAPQYNRELVVQPDGRVTIPQVGQVPAAGRSVEELRQDLEWRLREFAFVREPGVTVTPLKVNTTLQELRSTVDSRFGSGGQSRRTRVSPEGTVQLPAIGAVAAQGLTLAELKDLVESQYARLVEGVEVTPILVDRAPRFLYVVGEVRDPGRYELIAPTSAMQAITLAGGWNVGAKLDDIVIIRRDENWNLAATRLQLHEAFFGREPCPSDDVWLRDGDIVVVPKTHIQWTGDLIQQYFTRAIYGLLPTSGSVNLGGAGL